MKTRFSLTFLLKRFKELPNGTAPIYLRITIDEERVELSTKKYVLSAKWSSATQKVSGTSEEARTINAYLKTMEMDVFSRKRLKNRMIILYDSLHTSHTCHLCFYIFIAKSHK